MQGGAARFLARLPINDTTKEIGIMFCGKCGNQLGDGEMFCGKCGTPRNGVGADGSMPVSRRETGKGGGFWKRYGSLMELCFGALVLIGAVIFYYLPDSREALEAQASKMVREILTEHETFSSFFTIQKTANCLLVKTDKNSYSGSIDVYCRWKDASQKERMLGMFVEAAGGMNGAVFEGFKQQLGETQKFKFDVEMIADGERYNVTCQGSTKQEKPASGIILTMLELREDE